MANNYQNNLSEQLQLLHELGYSGLPTSYRTHNHKQSRDANRELRFLDAIAVALTTGNPGDVFAASFDKRKGMELVLAKNGLPTSEDIAAANELVSLIGSPTVADSIDLFPFLIRRCGENINKRIHHLHTSIQSRELRCDFTSALEAYGPEADIRAEFPGAHSLLKKYGDEAPSFSTMWQDVVQAITDRTSHGLHREDPLSTQKFAVLFLYANVLDRSRFLKTLVDDTSLLDMDCKERVQKLKRCLDKVCQYGSGITHLIQRAKRVLPISHHWVTDTLAGTGEGTFDLCDSPHDAVARGLGTPLLPEIALHKRFPSILSNWEKRRTVHPCIHAELRIILHLGPPSPHGSPVHPIGISKRSCFCCVLWMGSHNRLFRTQWLTSGSNGKLYANWALPGTACSYAVGEDGRSSVDTAVLGAVSARLKENVYPLLPGRRRVSEHVPR